MGKTARGGYFLRDRKRPQEGPFMLEEIIKIFRRVDQDGYTGDSFYRRSRAKEWRPLRSFAHYEFDDADFPRLDRFQRLGVKYVKWLTARHDDECTACKKLEGKIFLIDAPPPIPPVNCRCELWCKCMLSSRNPPSSARQFFLSSCVPYSFFGVVSERIVGYRVAGRVMVTISTTQSNLRDIKGRVSAD